jgi:hypothetical protein
VSTSKPTIQAKESRYNGKTYRSQIEAKYAVLFDDLAIDFRYEVQGYKLPTGEAYLPDFYLTRVGLFAEVKPFYNASAVKRIKRFVAAGALPRDIIVLFDEPRCTSYLFIERVILAERPEALVSRVVIDPFLRRKWYRDECRFYTGFDADEFCWPSDFSPEYVDSVNHASDAKFDHGKAPVPRRLHAPLPPKIIDIDPGPDDPKRWDFMGGAK